MAVVAGQPMPGGSDATPAQVESLAGSMVPPVLAMGSGWSRRGQPGTGHQAISRQRPVGGAGGGLSSTRSSQNAQVSPFRHLVIVGLLQ